MVSFSRVFYCLLLSTCLVTYGYAQDQYTLNGNASKDNCNCYTLTNRATFQSGSVWNKTKIDLRSSFDFVFNVFLGCDDGNGADGIGFMLQPLSTSLGATGNGLGFQGVSPSVGILLDTWQNNEDNDPAFDHISIQANGILPHGNDLAGPVRASSTGDNIEDCQWHTFRIAWNAATMQLTAYFDGALRLSAQRDLVATIFNNDPLVYWGFSAATGGSYNLQKFCTALNPGFATNFTGDATCIGNTVQFTNSSQSFAPITDYYWNMGDGTVYTSPTPPPHLYTAPGLYPVKLVIKGFDGCISDTLRRTVAIGDYPVAAFEAFDTCAGKPVRIIDRSSVTTGNINSWKWVLNGTIFSTVQHPPLTGLDPGNYTLELTVTSNYGCASAPVQQQFVIDPGPMIEASGEDGCINEPIQFQASQTDNATTITSWKWWFGDGQTGASQNITHQYAQKNNYDVKLVGYASNSCFSDTAHVPIFINQAYAHAGNDTVVIHDQPFRLQGSGGVTYQWSPATGLDDDTSPNPLGVLQNDITYTLTVTTAEGCTDEDDIKITVFKESAIYVPTGFTPNHDGLNDRLRPSYIGIRELAFFNVYNRWGQLVFSTRDLSKGWDGTFKGTIQPAGTYVWLLQATDYIGKQYQLKGSTTIVR